MTCSARSAIDRAVRRRLCHDQRPRAGTQGRRPDRCRHGVRQRRRPVNGRAARRRSQTLRQPSRSSSCCSTTARTRICATPATTRPRPAGRSTTVRPKRSSFSAAHETRTEETVTTGLAYRPGEPVKVTVANGRDFVLGHRGRDHVGLPLLAGPVAAKGLDRLCRLPALAYVDPARGEEVRGKREVQAAGRVTRLLDDLNAALRYASRCSGSTRIWPATMIMLHSLSRSAVPESWTRCRGHLGSHRARSRSARWSRRDGPPAHRRGGRT